MKSLLHMVVDRRNDAGIPKHQGHWVDPYYLPERRRGEKLVEYARRAPPDVQDYLRKIIRWTRDYPALAPPGWRRWVTEYERSADKKGG